MFIIAGRYGPTRHASRANQHVAGSAKRLTHAYPVIATAATGTL